MLRRDALPPPPADRGREMPVSASEIEKAESRAKASSPRQHAEECRLEAAGHCRKAHESDPKKSIRECAAEPGTSDNAPSDWAIKYGRTGKAAQARTGGQKEPGGQGGDAYRVIMSHLPVRGVDSVHVLKSPTWRLSKTHGRPKTGPTRRLPKARMRSRTPQVTPRRFVNLL